MTERSGLTKSEAELWRYWKSKAAGRVTLEEVQRSEAERVNELLDRVLGKHPEDTSSNTLLVERILKSSEFTPVNSGDNYLSYPTLTADKELLKEKYPDIATSLDGGDFVSAESLATRVMANKEISTYESFRALVAEHVDTLVRTGEVGALQSILNTHRILSRAGTPLFLTLAKHSLEENKIEEFCAFFAGKCFEELHAFPLANLTDRVSIGGYIVPILNSISHLSDALGERGGEISFKLRRHEKLQLLIKEHISYIVAVQASGFFTPKNAASDLVTLYRIHGVISPSYASDLLYKHDLK